MTLNVEVTEGNGLTQNVGGLDTIDRKNSDKWWCNIYTLPKGDPLQEISGGGSKKKPEQS